MIFTTYGQDLEHFLDQHTPGINVDYKDDDISVFLKLFILLCADNTVIFGENHEEHQQSLNAFQKYCEIRKLMTHTEKNKAMISSNGRISKNVHFYFNNKELEIVSLNTSAHIFIAKWSI